MGCVAYMLLVSVVLILSSGVNCEDDGRGSLILNELQEEGRTFVHHAMKRMAIILPAVFFKLGIAFTMLILVTIVAVNNGFIGFMLLVVGLSTVLSRFQDTRKSVVPVPIAYHPSPHYGHHHFLDRSDDGSSAGQSDQTTYATMTNPGYAGSGYLSSIPNPGYANSGIVYSNRYSTKR